MSRRRFAAALGVLALLGLAACRADPSVAAYVGAAKITEAQVTAVMDEVSATLEAEGPVDAENLLGIRDRVVEMLILTEAGTGYAEAEGLSLGEVSADDVAGQIGLEPDHAYVGVAAGFFVVINALQAAAEPGEVTEADQREVYDNIDAAGQQLPPFAEVQEAFTTELLGQPVGVRDLIADVVDRADIEVNPRYQLVYQVPVSLGQVQSWLGVPLGTPNDAVRDAD